MEGTNETRPSRHGRTVLATYRDGGGQGFPDSAGPTYKLIGMVEAYAVHAQIQAGRVPRTERGK